jgi:hypothetical protein
MIVGSLGTAGRRSGRVGGGFTRDTDAMRSQHGPAQPRGPAGDTRPVTTPSARPLMPDPRPPEPPPVDRRFVLSRHALGAMLLALLPILALSGLFGESQATRTAAAGDVRATVEFPERFRYKQLQWIEIRVENTSSDVIPLVVVTVDSSYLDRFSEVAFVPGPTDVTSDTYRFEIQDLAAGDSRVVSSGIQAERYWLSDGRITVTAGEAAPLLIPISTLVWP